MNWDKLLCRSLLYAIKFRRVDADTKHEDTQRRSDYNVFNAFNANNACWAIKNLPSKYANNYIFTYLLTYLLTPWSRVLLEKLTAFQLSKEFPTFYGTRRFITAFTSACHLSLSWASSIQFMPPHPIFWRSILILSSHLRLGLPSVSFPQVSSPKTLYTPLLSPMRATSHSSRFYHPHNIGCGLQIIKLLIK